jgi:hypothetical protein
VVASLYLLGATALFDRREAGLNGGLLLRQLGLPPAYVA